MVAVGYGSVEGADNLCDLLVFVEDALGAVTSSDAKVVEVGDAVGQGEATAAPRKAGRRDTPATKGAGQNHDGYRRATAAATPSRKSCENRIL